MLAVQGEGRGHLTQALTVYDLLKARGYEVCCIVVGTGARRVPDFFKRRVEAPVVSLRSPFFISKGSRSLDMLSTLGANLLASGSFLRSVRSMRRLVRRHRPDLIVNFYEPLVAMSMPFLFYKGRLVSISHQNVYLHSGFAFPSEIGLKRHMLSLYTRFVSMSSDLVLAISMYELPARRPADPVTVPPLLRRELFEKAPVSGDFYLVYLVNSGYMDDISRWHALHPGVRLHCFTDSEEVRSAPGGILRMDDALSFHALDGAKFLDMMSRCRGLVTTAGFETVCEAVFMGKPVLMVPVEGHLEQYCNAVDAARAGYAHRSAVFDPGILKDSRQGLPHGTESFRVWVRSAGDRFVEAVEGVLEGGAETEVAHADGGESIRHRARHLLQRMFHSLRPPGFARQRFIP